MKTVLKISLILAFCAIGGVLSIQGDVKTFIKTKKNKTIAAKTIKAESNGTLTYKDNNITSKIKLKDYIYARIVKPKSIKKAFKIIKAKKYNDAYTAFMKCYENYKFLGWDVYCIYYAAASLNKLGKKQQAINVLNKIIKTPIDPVKQKKYLEGRKMLAELYVALGKFDEAKLILSKLSGVSDPSFAAFANNQKGDIFLKQGKKKDALLEYLKTTLLFNKNNKKERPIALNKIIKIFKKDKNNKYLIYEKMLKIDYPTK